MAGQGWLAPAGPWLFAGSLVVWRSLRAWCPCWWHRPCRQCQCCGCHSWSAP
jgi:hypothetical protein